MKLIDDVDVLVDLPTTELIEALLDPKYNKANLRELLRRSIASINYHKKSTEYYKQRLEVALSKQNKTANEVLDVINRNFYIEQED